MGDCYACSKAIDVHCTKFTFTFSLFDSINKNNEELDPFTSYVNSRGTCQKCTNRTATKTWTKVTMHAKKSTE